MRKPDHLPERIAVTYHPHLEEAQTLALDVCHSLEDLGASPLSNATLYDREFLQRLQNNEFDLLITLGGDGTMLRAGNLCAPLGIPILGINIGRFGFLIEVQKGEWATVLPRLLSGNYWLEDRMMLHTEHWRNDLLLDQWEALNEVVVCRGQYVRPIRIAAYVDDNLMTHYVADGLIASTATGSTAYAMAASGPIMPPELRNILVIAVAPHLSVDRAIILPEGSRITMRVDTNHEAVLSVDGHLPVTVLPEDEVRCAAGDYGVAFVRFQDAGYFYKNLTRYMERNPSSGEYA